MVCSQPIIGECTLTPSIAQILINQWVDDWEQGKLFNGYSVYDHDGNYIAHVSFRYGKVSEVYMRVILMNGKQAFLDEITNAFIYHLTVNLREKGHLFFGIMIRSHNAHDQTYQPILKSNIP